MLLTATVWTAWALVTARTDLNEARAAVEAARADTPLSQTQSRLASAEHRLADADRRLSGAGPALVSQIPILGRTPRAAELATRAARAAVTSGQRVLTATSDGPPLVQAGRIDPGRLAAVAAVLRRASTDVAGPVGRLRRANTSMTPAALSRGVQEARDQLNDLPRTLTQSADALDALAGLTGGDRPRRLLIALENNAELRGTGGIVTVFAEATCRDGRIELQGFRDVDDVADPAASARRVPSPADYHRLWGPYLADTTLWKNANMSPDVATSSAVLARIAATTLHHTPDAVVWLDVRTLAEIVGATSPAPLPDGTVLTKESTVPALLSGAYRTAVDSVAGQAARRARLRAAADAVATRLLQGSPDIGRLALALGRSTRGRHLAVWSAEKTEQKALAAASVAGEIRAGGRGGDLVSVAIQNFGGGDKDGNKLDFYARRLVRVRVRVSHRSADVVQEVTLRNTAPAHGLPVYVAGGATPGTSNNYLTLAVPADAVLESFTRGGVPVRTEVLPEGDHRVVTDALSLPPGASATWRLRYRAPLRADGTYSLRVFPQPLAVDAGLNLQITGDGRPLRTAAGRIGDVRVSGPFAEQQTWSIKPVQLGALRRAADAVRRFWREPVRLPFS